MPRMAPRSLWERRLWLRGAGAVALGVSVACSDSATAPRGRPTPQSGSFLVAAPSVPAPQSAYLSLPPGVIPSGSEARLRVLRTGATAVVPLVNGGFDPVALEAAVGDTVAIDVQAGTLLSYRVAVPRPSRPAIVRTSPPPNKRDVPLNTNVVVVFSEPIDQATLTHASVQLRKGGVAVAGRLAFADGAHLTAQFLPNAPLAANTEYALVVTGGIRDLDGLALQDEVTVSFTTGTSAGAATGTVQVITTASGFDLDPDGYALVIERAGASLSSTAIAVGGAVTSPALPSGSYTVTLTGVAANCVVGGGGPMRKVDVAAGVAVAITFPVACDTVTQLAFAGAGRIQLVNSNGTGLVPLTDGPYDESPVWSPDGKRIAFMRWHVTANVYVGVDIYIMDADGSHLVRRTTANYNYFPTWSPDGGSIAFSNIGSGDGVNVYVMSAIDNGASPRIVAAGDGWNPAWSPDGKKIAFSRGRTFGHTSDIYLTSPSGPPATRLTHGADQGSPIDYDGAAWSPDGRKLAVNVCAFEYDEICPLSSISMMNADGTGIVALTDGPYDIEPNWSPDGRTIAFSSSGSIAWIRTDGSARGVIVARGSGPAWRPVR